LLFLGFSRRRAAPRQVSAPPPASVFVFPERCCRFSSRRAVGVPVLPRNRAAIFSVEALGFCAATAGRVHVFLSSQRHTVGCAISSASSLQFSLIRGSIIEAGPVFVLGCSRFLRLSTGWISGPLPLERDAADGFNPCQRWLA
jgi:hypothetical protein